MSTGFYEQPKCKMGRVGSDLGAITGAVAFALTLNIVHRELTNTGKLYRMDPAPKGVTGSIPAKGALLYTAVSPPKGGWGLWEVSVGRKSSVSWYASS